MAFSAEDKKEIQNMIREEIERTVNTVVIDFEKSGATREEIDLVFGFYQRIKSSLPRPSRSSEF